MAEEKPEVDIMVNTAPDFESITISFLAEKKDLSIGFSIGEAQQLYLYLGEAITSVMLHNLKIDSAKITH